MSRARPIAWLASFAWTMAAALCVALPACSSAADPCDEAVAAAAACGMPMDEATCEALPVNDRQAVGDGLSKLTCESDNDPTPDTATCQAAGWPCPAALGPAPSGQAPKNAMVFVSGISDAASFDWHPAILRAVVDGSHANVVHAVLPAFTSRDERAASLWSTLLANGAGASGTGGPRFNLVCYAVGGIDCRYLASPAGLFASDPDTYATVNAAIASVTTMDTPHRGTQVADAAVLALEAGSENDLLAALGVALPGNVGTLLGSDAGSLSGGIVSGALLDSFRALSLVAESTASEALVDGDGIVYQSFAGVSHVGADAAHPAAADVAAHCVDAKGAPAFFGGAAAASLVDAMQIPLVATSVFGGAYLDTNGATVSGPTDGMIAVDSAKWGTFRGCLPTDHYHVIGQIGRKGQDVRTGFDAPRFYTWLAGDLAAQGL